MSEPRYIVTSAEWSEATVEKFAGKWDSFPEVIPSVDDPGEGWELVAFSATDERLFWTWRRTTTPETARGAK